MKGKKKVVKEITLNDKPASRMEGRSYYIRSNFNFSYLDCNNVGDIYFSLDEPCKWEFIKTETPGAYYIKHINTDLYLTSNEKGDIFSTVELQSSFQKWKVFGSSTPEVFGYQNLSNELYIHVSLRDEIYLDIKDDKIQRGLMNTFAKFPKK